MKRPLILCMLVLALAFGVVLNVLSRKYQNPIHSFMILAA